LLVIQAGYNRGEHSAGRSPGDGTADLIAVLVTGGGKPVGVFHTRHEQKSKKHFVLGHDALPGFLCIRKHGRSSTAMFADANRLRLTLNRPDVPYGGQLDCSAE
jgi:hypothetical protein